MRDKPFAQRLNIACDGHPHIPPYGHGRQTWVKEKLDVSHEAVRKWFVGETRPRPAKMRELARVLEVDEAWLSLGIVPDATNEEKRVRTGQVEGAVNCVAGLVQLNGGHIAFPGPKDPRGGFVDFYAIIKGSQYAVNVSLAKHITNGTYRFTIPKEYDQCKVAGVIHVLPLRIHCVSLTHEIIDEFKVRKGGYFELTVNRVGSEYFIGDTKVPRVVSFADRL